MKDIEIFYRIGRELLCFYLKENAQRQLRMVNVKVQQITIPSNDFTCVDCLNRDSLLEESNSMHVTIPRPFETPNKSYHHYIVLLSVKYFFPLSIGAALAFASPNFRAYLLLINHYL